MKCAPYHPSSNGFAECFIRNFKQTECNLERWPDSATQVGKHPTHLLCGNTYYHRVSPSTLFLGQEVCTRLDLLAPQLESRVSPKQLKMQHDHRAKFRIGQKVMVRNVRPGTMFMTKLWRSAPLSSWQKLEMELSDVHTLSM